MNKLTLLALAASLAACNMDRETSATANVEPRNDSDVSGTVKFEEKNGKVIMNAEIFGLTEGEHAIHIHEYGDCVAHDGSSAGGHWNPTNEDHGKWGQPPFHMGDIGNITADSKGNAIMRLETNSWCVGCADSTKNIVGKSIIIHEGVDDFVSQPSGDAGARIGCGVIVSDQK